MCTANWYNREPACVDNWYSREPACVGQRTACVNTNIFSYYLCESVIGRADSACFGNNISSELLDGQCQQQQYNLEQYQHRMQYRTGQRHCNSSRRIVSRILDGLMINIEQYGI